MFETYNLELIVSAARLPNLPRDLQRTLVRLCSGVCEENLGAIGDGGRGRAGRITETAFPLGQGDEEFSERGGMLVVVNVRRMQELASLFIQSLCENKGFSTCLLMVAPGQREAG